MDLKLDPNGSGKIVVTANLEPDTDGQHDIGSTSKKFNNVHTEKFTTESGVFDGQTSDPSNPVTGQVYYNSSTNNLKVYDGAWKNINTTSSAGIELTDLSVGAEASASGDGGIAYDNTSGVFTYTPPVIPTNNNQLTNGAGFITSYTVTESDVTSHQAALSITESQISDLQSYLTSYTVTESDVTSHQAALSITESQISDLGSYITASSTETLTNKSGNVSMFTNDSGYVTSANTFSFTILTGDGSTIFSAAAGNRYGVDTSSGTATVNLPGSPSAGDTVFFADAGGAFATYNLTIGRNGNTIMGLSQDMTVSLNNDSTGLFYSGTTWRIF